MQKIQMVDLKGQYNRIKSDIDAAISDVINSAAFINGSSVKTLEDELTSYTNSGHCIACANGTDALQISMMALEIKPGEEVIMPSFSFIAVAETAALLGVKPVFVDSDPHTFNIDISKIEASITPKTKAIIPVHLFGQCADMEYLLKISSKYTIPIIEDSAQALGAEYCFSNQLKMKTGTMGTVGTTSFFPSKNLGCYGDGGAIFTKEERLADKIRMIANHGQKNKYIHEVIGINSRLDTLQAAILNVKLKKLNSYSEARNNVASYYDNALAKISEFSIPSRDPKSSHVFNQYTLTLKNNVRNDFKEFLESKNIPSMIHYPTPIHLQKAYQYLNYKRGDFPVAENLSENVISLPMHTELMEDQLSYICENILNYFKK